MTQIPSAHLFRIAMGVAALGLGAAPAHASMMSPEVEDKVATVISWIVLFVVPVIGILLFLLVHVLPEKIAKKRHHPQKDAIHMLCLLSLFFGGLLWPLAWLWAYARPTAYKLAYGTDKHDSYYAAMADRAKAGELDADELEHLKTEFASIEAVGQLNPTLKRARTAVFEASSQPAPAFVPAPVFTEGRTS